MNEVRKRIEELTDEFLRLNDPYFTKKGNKSNDIEYPYLSKSQMKKTAKTEITLSNLSNRQRCQCPKFGDLHDFEEA